LFSEFIDGAFDRDGQRWSIFSLFKLVESSQFLQVAG